MFRRRTIVEVGQYMQLTAMIEAALRPRSIPAPHVFNKRLKSSYYVNTKISGIYMHYMYLHDNPHCFVFFWLIMIMVINHI